MSTVRRSQHSLQNLGVNVAVSLRPNAAVVVIRTTLGYLITYSLQTHGNTLSYQLQFPEGYRYRFQRRSATLPSKHGATARGIAQDGQGTIHAASLECRRIDLLGVDVLDVLATDDEMLISTDEPPSVQCVQWGSDEADTVETMADLDWMAGSAPVIKMSYDKPMRLYIWITKDGRAYAIQRHISRAAATPEPGIPASETPEPKPRISTEEERHVLALQKTKSLGDRSGFSGHCFYSPTGMQNHACHSTINSRFSLIALGLQNGVILIFHIRDYHGDINLIHKIESTSQTSTSSQLNALEYSPDGHCLIAGLATGWETWSVFGKPLASSFSCDRDQASENSDEWLLSTLR